MEESILAELASKGIVDSLSLAIATTDNPEQFETMDLVDVKSPFKKDKRPQFSLTKSVDRHHFNEDFVKLHLFLKIYSENNNKKHLY